ncbi:MAG: glutathione peroxidase [Peptostreptococcaceae bacterium]|nr:glutathione peroxidase [Peptostreptococcaceae bacterium]
MNLYKTDLEVTQMNGDTVKLSSFEGKVLLIVNTASKCGFTPQFEGLEELYKKYEDKGLMILGFPCNQFKNQDPGDNKEILEFCQLNYGVTFPMFQKIEVNGENRHPLYQYLIENNLSKNSSDIKWNFEKFLVDKNGEIIKRYPSLKKPKAIDKDIFKLL